MKKITIAGICLIIAGVAMLTYGHFSYQTREQVLKVGPIQATTERTKTVALPPVLGWALVGGGAVMLIFGFVRPKE